MKILLMLEYYLLVNNFVNKKSYIILKNIIIKLSMMGSLMSPNFMQFHHCQPVDSYFLDFLLFDLQHLL